MCSFSIRHTPCFAVRRTYHFAHPPLRGAGGWRGGRRYRSARPSGSRAHGGRANGQRRAESRDHASQPCQQSCDWGKHRSTLPAARLPVYYTYLHGRLEATDLDSSDAPRRYLAPHAHDQVRPVFQRPRSRSLLVHVTGWWAGRPGLRPTYPRRAAPLDLTTPLVVPLQHFT